MTDSTGNTGVTASKLVEAAWNARRGIQTAPTPEPTAEEQARLDAERLDRAAGLPARMAEGKRYTGVRRALLSSLGTLKHGRRYNAADRAALAADVEQSLGSLSDSEREAVRALVATSCDAIAEGDKVTALRAIDATADALVNGNASLEAGPSAEVSDPAALAALVARG